MPETGYLEPMRRIWDAADIRALARLTGLIVDTSPAALLGVEEDHSHLVCGRPEGIVRPTTARQVQGLVRYAYEQNLTLTPRGLGHSGSGQSIPLDSLSVDLSHMNIVGQVDMQTKTVTCQAGTTWRQLIACLPVHLVPFAMPTYLDLTVAGTLSTGGMGTAVSRFGPAAAHVAALDVVDGTGELHHCSARVHANSRLFYAALSGLGRCGIITGVTLRLRETTPRTTVFRLVADTVEEWHQRLRDIAALTDWQHLDALCSLQSASDGTSVWRYEIEVATDIGLECSDALQRILKKATLEMISTPDFPTRFDTRFAALETQHIDTLAHPVFECFLPRHVSEVLLPQLLSLVPPEYMIRLLPVERHGSPPFLAFPKGEIDLLAILTLGIEPDRLPDCLRRITRIDDLCITAGAKRYPAGWIPDTTLDYWKTHYGDRWADWRDAKQRHDPRAVFTSRLFPSRSEEGIS